MKFSLAESVDILERTPSVVNNLLKGLPKGWIQGNEGPGTWSPFDVVGHLIHGERTDWVPRTKIILFGEDKNFVPFDRFAQILESEGKTIDQLLNEFSELRKNNLIELNSFQISEVDLEKTGIHPEFGHVKLKQLLAAWVAHDMGHIVQISRVLAKQYKEETGPWPKYLAVLNS